MRHAGFFYETQRDAVLSRDRVYRYVLKRFWHEGPRCCFIGLNPSTADETKDDATLIRCMNFARSWGYAGMYMVNLFAFRATNPKVMRAAKDPIGKRNDAFLKKYAAHSDIIVACWGAGGEFMHRDELVYKMLRKPFYSLAVTNAGQPRHPLRLPRTLKPVLWVPK